MRSAIVIYVVLLIVMGLLIAGYNADACDIGGALFCVIGFLIVLLAFGLAWKKKLGKSKWTRFALSMAMGGVMTGLWAGALMVGPSLAAC